MTGAPSVLLRIPALGVSYPRMYYPRGLVGSWVNLNWPAHVEQRGYHKPHCNHLDPAPSATKVLTQHVRHVRDTRQPQTVKYIPLVTTCHSAGPIFKAWSPGGTIVSITSHYILEIIMESISRWSFEYHLTKTSSLALLVMNLDSLGITNSGLFAYRSEFILYILLPFTYVYINIYLSTERDFNELAHAAMETGMSKICRVGWQSGDPGKSWYFSPNLKPVCWHNSLLLGAVSLLFYSGLWLIRKGPPTWMGVIWFMWNPPT